MKTIGAAVFVLVCSGSARADHVAPFVGSTAPEPVESKHVFASFGASLGVTNRDGGALSGSLRPEVLFAPTGDHGAAFGPYGDLGRGAGDTFVGAGLTATYYFDSPITVSSSVGVYHRWTEMSENGVSASILLGVRMPRLMGGGDHFDLPYGIRFDYRGDRRYQSEVVVSLTGDLAFPIASRLRH